MKTKIVVSIVLLLAAIAGWFLPSESSEQLHRLEIIDAQLQDIKKSNNQIERTLQEYIDRPVTTSRVLQGEASIYSVDGCLGCDPNRIMANGERLDDNRKTVALPCTWVRQRCTLPFKLGQKVRIANPRTGKATVATFTDTFNGIYGRVADLSLAAAKAIDCHGLCQVQIYES